MAKAYSLEQVREIFKKENCVLLSKEYKNSNSKLHYLCSCGNHDTKDLNHFMNRGHRCPSCTAKKKIAYYKKRKLDVKTVESFFNRAGYTLMTKDYQNARQKLDTLCPNGHIYKVSYDAFRRSGSRCKKCQGISEYDLKSVKLLFARHDCTLLEKEYINSNTPMKYICSCGNVSEIRLQCFLRGQRCINCKGLKISSSKRTSFTEVKKVFNLAGCILLTEEKEYHSRDQKLSYICACGKRESVSFHSFKKTKKRCHECFNQSKRGSNHYNYNHDKTVEERMLGRKYEDYYLWVKSVYERDGYTCQICGLDNCKLNAHHLDSYDWCIDGRTELENGVTLCVDCHKNFHEIYGYGSNTKWQFEEYAEGIYLPL
ncbi:HNH endonuclease [Bacillus licheniformis]